MSLISIIIPVYNGEKTIQETIFSILNQTYQHFEIIIINDGSTDSTLEVISSIPNPQIKVFSYPNSGVSASRNRGIALASGEYISFIDADDLWTPDKLEAQLNALQKHPQAAVAYSWTDWIDESGQVISSGGHHQFSGDVYKHLFLGDFVEGGSNVLIRKSALDKVGVFDESINFSEDWELWLRLAAQYQYIVIPRTQILYRISHQSASFNVLQMEKSSLQVIQKAIDNSPQPIEFLQSQCLANRYKYLICKTLDSYPMRKNGLIAIRFLWNILYNDPKVIKSRVFWKILLKIAVVMILPPQKSKQLFEKVSKPFDIQTLLMQIKLNPSLP
ncbi:MAG: glycosyltransferase [Microcoleaceae cyanobacterium]